MTNKGFTPTHPGEVIKDELIARGISQKDFALRIGVPYTMLNDILNERRPLSASVALFIESALGISADLLMGLQQDYAMQKARNDEMIKRKLRKIQSCSPSIATTAVA
ncbi:MAG: HigA family addiction module antidote protein [Bacteroidales bacterium]|nr:HigA family addiction module antidote protein [Bacteroidales bacterium]